MNKPLRLGLVGLGKIARDQHLPAIAAEPALELIAVASHQGGMEGPPLYPNVDVMLASETGIEAVILCVPPQQRFDAARSAILAGKHVLLEKPPGATLSEVEALAEAARRLGVTLFASWHSREAAAVAPAKTWLADAAIRSVNISWKEDVRVWHPGQTWIWQPGGFGVFDPGINALSILTEILPEPVRLLSAELEGPSNLDAPIAASLVLQTPSGAPIVADFDFRQTGPQSWDIAIESDKGALVLSLGGSRWSTDGLIRPVAASEEYPALYRRFLQLVRDGASDVDVAPLRLVADAFLNGKVRRTDPFVE